VNCWHCARAALVTAEAAYFFGGGRLIALGPTGEHRWREIRLPRNNDIERSLELTTPEVQGDTLCLGVGRSAERKHDGFVRAEGLWTGEARWTIPTFGHHAPTIDGDLVFFSSSGVRGQGTAQQRPLLRAVELSTGQERWRTALSAEASRLQPLVRDGMVFVLLEGTGLSAFDARTGAQRWVAEMRAFGVRRITAGGGLLYVVASTGDSTGLHAIDMRTGATRWQSTSPWAVPYDEMTYADGKLFFGNACRHLGRPGQPARLDSLGLPVDEGSCLVALDATTGETAWRLKLRRGPPWVVRVAAGVAYFYADGLQGALTESGRVVWGPVRAGEPLAAFGDRLLAVSNDEVEAFRLIRPFLWHGWR